MLTTPVVQGVEGDYEESWHEPLTLSGKRSSIHMEPIS